jgi:hypothetical protein
VTVGRAGTGRLAWLALPFAVPTATPASSFGTMALKLQICERNAHRACERPRIHPLDLFAETAAAIEQQQVEQRHPLCA